MPRPRGGTVRPDDLTRGAHGAREADGSAECTQVDHPIGPRPQERVRFGVAGDVAVSDDVALVVDCARRGVGSPEGAEIDQAARRRPRKGV
jgi:hypothetical protein